MARFKSAGTLDNTGRDLAFDGDGTLELWGGTIRGGSLAEGITLNASSGILDAFTVSGHMVVANDATTSRNGLVVNGLVSIGSNDAAASLGFEGSQVLSGTGAIRFDGSLQSIHCIELVPGYLQLATYQNMLDVRSGTLTLGEDLTIRGEYGVIGWRNSGSQNQAANTAVSVVTHATITPDVPGQSITFMASGFANSTITGAIRASGPGTLSVQRAGTESDPLLLEVQGRDLGSHVSGFNTRSLLGGLSISNSHVTLIDNADDASGVEPEALYTNRVDVGFDSTLHLNLLKLYAREANLSGLVAGGNVAVLSDLAVQSVSVPVAASPGESVTFSWSVQNRGSQSIDGWQDAVYLQEPDSGCQRQTDRDCASQRHRRGRFDV